MRHLPHIFPTVVHMLLAAAEGAPEREALVCGDERLTYEEYVRCVTGFAHELQTLGAAGGRVALLMGNSIDICIATFAAHMAGAQVTPLNPLYTAPELLPMLRDTQAQVLVHDRSTADRDRELVAELAIPHRVEVGPARRLTAWREDDRPLLLPELPAAGDPGTLQFTGGTTGRAKGADISHYSLAVNISQREALVPFRDDVERCLCVMPLFHCYASHMNLHAMAYRRGTLVILPRYRPEEVLRTIGREQITIFGGSPTLFSGLIQHAAFEDADFSSLYLSSSGSAPLPERLLRQWEQGTAAPVIEGYGQSETGPVISFNPLDGPRKLQSVGIPLPRTELQVVDTESGTRVLPPGERGEIRLRGPQVMRGYRNNPDETARTLREGWHYTGDIGELDGDGYLFIRGRKKEMIIVSGYNVFPREVEEVLHAHPQVAEAAVVGREDAYRGELPVAFIVCRESLAGAPDVLAAWCGERLARYKIPAEFNIVDALPKTAVGKVDKLRLAELAQEAGAGKS